MYIVVYGSLQDGHHFVGPFGTYEEATNYAGSLMETCEVVELDPPKEEEDK